MALKIIIRNFEESQHKLQEIAVKRMLKGSVDPNTPMLTTGNTALMRIFCGECGEVSWVRMGQYSCDLCFALSNAENELERQLHRKEREVRLREAEKALAELD